MESRGKKREETRGVAGDSVESRLAALSTEVARLANRVSDLAERCAALESAMATARPAAQEAPPSASSEDRDTLAPFQEEGLWNWISRSALLPRLAAVCFALVVALVLRVLSDNDILNAQIGSFVGIAYSLGLIASGWWLLGRGSPLGPVLPACGALLLYSVVLEAHGRFAVVTDCEGYAVLAITIVTLPVLGWRFGRSGLACLGLLGGSCTALVLGFPRPLFPALVLVLLLANVVAAFASRRQAHCAWSRWPLYVAGILVWFLWTAKLRVVLERQGEAPAFLAQNWFLPLLFGYASAFMAVAGRRLGRNEQPMLFDQVVPTVNGLLAYIAAWVVISSGRGPLPVLGMVGAAMAAVHLAVAFWYYKAGRGSGGGICVFTTAGAVLLSLAMPALTRSLPLSLLTWAAIAYGMALLTSVCEVGGIRLLSYVLPVAACVTGTVSGIFSVKGAQPMTGMTTALTLALASGLQYRWSRRNRLICSSGLLATLDPNDRSAALLLLTALVNGFFGLRLGALLMLEALGAGPDANLLSGIDSLIINAAAICLMVLGVQKRSGEILAAAVLAAFTGAVKVFGHDLFHNHGILMVAGVFSSGLVALAGSIAIGRWQQIKSARKVVSGRVSQ